MARIGSTDSFSDTSDTDTSSDSGSDSDQERREQRRRETVLGDSEGSTDSTDADGGDTDSTGGGGGGPGSQRNIGGIQEGAQEPAPAPDTSDSPLGAGTPTGQQIEDATGGRPSGFDPDQTFGGQDLATESEDLADQGNVSAQELETRFVENNPGVTREDVVVTRGDDARLVAGLSQSAYWGRVNRAIDDPQQVSTGRLRDVQEYSQRRADERGEAYDQAVRRFNQNNFRDVQEFAQRRADRRRPAIGSGAVAFAGGTPETVGAVRNRGLDLDDYVIQRGRVVGERQTAGEAFGGVLDYFESHRERARTGLSASSAMTLTEGDQERAEQLAAGEERIFELAEEGNLAALTFTGGEIFQNIGSDVRGGVEYISPIDRVPVVGEGVERGIGGIAEGVFVLGGQIPQAASAPFIPGQSQSPSELVGGTIEGTQAGAENVGRFAQENPIEAATLVAFPYAVRGGARAVRRGRSGTRNVETIDYAELTSERGARGEIPEFQRTGTGEPTSRAVREVSERAGDQPEALTRATESESAVFHTSGERLGPELRVGEGQSELPGIFTSPDVNPVGLRSTPFGETGLLATSLRPTRPRLSSDRIAMFRDPEIAGMPREARGAGYEIRVGGERTTGGLGRGEAKSLAERIEGAEVAPDTATRGYRFLTEGAEPGTAYVRPRGSRTPELEAIYPPESAFIEGGSTPPLAARIGGRELSVPFTDRSFTFGGERVPIDVFSRAETRRVGEARAGEATAGEIGRTYTPTSQISARRVGTPSEAYLSGLGTSALASDRLETTETTSTFATEPAPSPISEPSTTSMLSEPSTSVSEPSRPTEPTTSFTPSEPSEPPRPTQTPTTPPSTPPSAPPSIPPSTPPSTPPTTPPLTPPEPPSRPRLSFDLPDADERKREDEFEFEAAPIYTDFLNPISGELIETERAGATTATSSFL